MKKDNVGRYLVFAVMFAAALALSITLSMYFINYACERSNRLNIEYQTKSCFPVRGDVKGM